jgi:hypothetical protein
MLSDFDSMAEIRFSMRYHPHTSMEIANLGHFTGFADIESFATQDHYALNCYAAKRMMRNPGDRQGNTEPKLNCALNFLLP